MCMQPYIYIHICFCRQELYSWWVQLYILFSLPKGIYIWIYIRDLDNCFECPFLEPCTSSILCCKIFKNDPMHAWGLCKSISVEPLKSYDFVELWAGRALTSTVIRKSGRNVAALDIEYFKPNPEKPQRSNHFDILTESRFLHPALIWKRFSWFVFV